MDLQSAGNLSLSNNATNLVNNNTYNNVPLWMRIAAGFIAGGTALIGGIENLTVLLAFATHKRSMWVKQNIYIFCLTISDLIIAMVMEIEALDQFLSSRWRHSAAWCRIYITISTIAFVGSLNLIALISRDRMLMVTKGHAYDAYESTGRKWLIVVCSFVYLLLLMVPYTSLDIFTGYSVLSKTGYCSPELMQILVAEFGFQALFALPPFLYMFYCYARVRQYFKRHNATNTVNVMKVNQVAPATARTTHSLHRRSECAGKISAMATPRKSVVVGRPTNNSVAAARAAATIRLENTKRKTRIMHVLILNAVCCAIPSVVLTTIMYALTLTSAIRPKRNFAWWSHLYELTFMFGGVSSAVNPILYAYGLPAFRKAMHEVVWFVWKRKRGAINS